MIRTLIGLPVLLILLAAGALYAAYGEVEPCRVLAIERARRAQDETGLPIRGLMERWSRLETSQLSTRECASDLLDSWGGAIIEKQRAARELIRR